MTHADNADIVVEFTRPLIAALAPGELALFGAMSRAWAENPARAQPPRESDDKLAFGIAEAGALLTPVLLTASSEALSYLGKEVAHEAALATGKFVRARLRRLFGGERDSVRLDAQQIARVRGIALETVQRYRLPKAKAEQIADAVAARLLPGGD